ncbi:type I glyceraldehyde-3-phosphate dehydrogenase [candidate division WWE3 bacterium RIFCSPHIGHO2_01_FULL_42_13]|uniref:Glyceraldehyde-3-phosphate dehydrogenase n=1 Tax=candidate division WWE3 bacterium RIFCSPHIGHO2_01_FULL_42_13 TaxID=1802617 RepID=A0A1F4USD6_UNCKA|nr:MAG: type I glyceraldehyde-3-phosphate dehydrogenase [candidate division WWE3 bacterium RIFCSPHIGHO2_01_FULL_42_13]
MPIKVAINGFGRIGRAAFRIIDQRSDCEVVALNDLGSIENMAYLLKYDTPYGRYEKEVSSDSSSLIVGGKKIPVFAEKDPAKLPWKDLSVDVVLECTGVFVKDGSAKVHLEAGARKVVVSAPTKGENDDIQTFMLGVNHESYLGQNVISNASCTTNCISPVVSVLHSKFKILKSVMTTVHSYTASQSIVDSPNKDFREGRAAAQNIIPTSTGAAISTTKAIPELQGIFDGISIRVPTVVGSLSDITCLVGKKTTVEEVNNAFIEAAKNPFYKGVLEVSNDPLVSSDIIGNPHSAIIDLSFTRVVDGDLVKVLAWYDNEWGYANRLVEMALLTVA